MPYSNTERFAALADFLHVYNHHRCHTALGSQPPISRVNNAPGQYIWRTGSLCTAGTAAADEAARTERHLPMPVAVAHGILAAIMQVLVLLTALDVRGS